MDQTQQNAPVAPAPQVQPQPVQAQPQPVAQPQPAPQAAPVYEPQPVAQPQIVTDNGRTRQEFEKLLERNNELARTNAILQQEMQRRAQVTQQYAPLQQTPQTPAQVDPRDFVEVDANGVEYINEQKLKSKIDEVNQRAMRSEQMVQNYIQTSEQREQERQNRETFNAYPELNPANTDKFDKGFHNRTRQVMIDALVNPQEYGGRALTFKEAADLVRQEYAPASPVPGMDSNDAVQQQQAAEGAAIKQQASVTPVSQPQAVRSNVDDEELHRRLSAATRMGDEEALAIRLKYTNHVRTPSGD